MKRVGFVAALMAVLLGAARANLRAPKKADGFLSGSVKAMMLDGAVSLLREDLKVVFPDFHSKLDPDRAVASVTARYEIDNSSQATVRVPLKFLAVDVRDLSVKLNGEEIPASLCPDAEEKTECLVRLARHRAKFLPDLYRVYLSELRRAAGIMDAPEAEWLSRLDGVDLSQATFRVLFPRTFMGDDSDTDFRRAGFAADLRPGRNTLEVRYGQRLFIEERGHGYFAGWPKKGFSAFDYLLYPASSWPRAGDFGLAVRVEVPDYYEKKLLGASRRKAWVRCSPALVEVGNARARRRVLEGRFSGLPADVLTVVVWFDKAAMSSVSTNAK